MNVVGDISGVDEYIGDDFEEETVGELADKLDRRREVTQPQWIANLFDESGESGDKFKGFHQDWVTDPHQFRPVNVPGCLLDGGARISIQEMTAGYTFGLMCNDEISSETK